jgi:hypothetical protein
MKNGTKIFLIYTCIYFFGVLVLLVINQLFFNTLQLNEIGDYFAGLLAPLALLWFVLAYFKQSEDVKQNAEALMMQAEELKNSVQEMQKSNEIANVQKQVVMANEAHTRRDVFLQLKDVLIDRLIRESEILCARVIMSHEVTTIDSKFDSGDRFAYLYWIGGNDISDNSYSYIIEPAKNYCTAYEMLIKEAESSDTDNNMLIFIYKAGIIYDVYIKLKSYIEKNGIAN